MSKRSQNEPVRPAVAMPMGAAKVTTRGMVARWVVLVIVLLSIPAFGFSWIVRSQANEPAPASPPAEATPAPQE